MADDVRDLDGWLAPFLPVMGRKTRRSWAPLYLQGLLGPGERKSVQPMAARLGFGGHDQLQHFVASTAWDDGLLWTVLAQEADRLVGGPGAYLVIDDTALPKLPGNGDGGRAFVRGPQGGRGAVSASRLGGLDARWLPSDLGGCR